MDSFGVQINLGLGDESRVEKGIEKVIQRMIALGKTEDEVKREVAKIWAEFAVANPHLRQSLSIHERLVLAEKQYNKELAKHLRAQQQLDKLQNKNRNNPPDSEKFKQRAMFAGYSESTFGRALLGLKSLNLAFSEAKGVWRFAEGIEKVNQRLLQLHYSSGMGIGSLKDLGAAAKAFGGSAESIASAEERRQEQMAKARRGQGFGYLQETYWKYGFGVDFGWDANRTRQEAIKYARGNLSPDEYMAFAMEIDPANAKWMTGIMRMSEQEYKAFLEYQERLSAYSDLLTADGKKRTDETRKNTQSYEMASAELSRSWEAVKDEVANALLPHMITLINKLRAVTDFLNKHPALIKTGAIVTAIGAVTAGLWKLGSALRWFWRLLPFAKGAAAAAESAGAGATAAGAAGTIRTTTGTVAKSLSKGLNMLGRLNMISSVGSMATGAIGDIGIGVILYRIASTILEPWFAMWQVYALRGYVGSEDAIRKALGPIVTGMGLSGSSAESFINKWVTADKMTVRMAKNENVVQDAIYSALKNKTSEGLISLDPSSLANLQHAEMSFNNNSTIDNSKTQNIQNISINGAQDPQAVGQEVANAGRAMMGSVMNGSNAH